MLVQWYKIGKNQVVVTVCYITKFKVYTFNKEAILPP